MIPGEKDFVDNLSYDDINKLSLSISETILIEYDKLKIEILL
jgi:hypothetical protein